MTHKVMKSALVPANYKIEAAIEGFGKLVASHIEELKAWHAQQVAVRAHDDNPLVKPEWGDFVAAKDPAAEYMKARSDYNAELLKRPAPYPAPEAPADVAAAVKEVIDPIDGLTYVADFEVVNDDPTPEEMLVQFKAAQMERVAAAEAAAIEKLLPPLGKRRLLELREQDIMKADMERMAKAVKEKRGDTFVASDERPEEDTIFLHEREDQRTKIAAVQRRAAEALAEIEDLTLDTADAFALPNFD